MAYKAKYTTQLAIRLSPAQKEGLEAIADRDEVSVGHVIRTAIDAELGREESKSYGETELGSPVAQ